MTAALAYNQQTKGYDVNPSAEQVLAFPAYLIRQFRDEAPAGILTNPVRITHYLKSCLYSGQATFIDRAFAESNPEFKQVIPYVVFTKVGTHEVFAYQRTKKGGESRLHDNWSIGVGGHINPVDGPVNSDDTYYRAMHRELMEEISFVCEASPKTAAPIVALIYDDSNDVGKVHFGVVHLFHVPIGTEFTSADPSLSRGTWIDPTEPGRNFENWSQLAISSLF